MTTLDVVAQAGGAPANFLDAGGGSKADAITSAVEVILSDPKVKDVLFNIFGGITRCDEVAKGLIEAFAQINPTVPFVVRLDGTNDHEGRRLLAEADLPNVHTETTMDGAAKRVVQLAAAPSAHSSVPTPSSASRRSPLVRARFTRCAIATTGPRWWRCDAGQGRPGGGGDPGDQYFPRRRRGHRSQHAMIFVPPALPRIRSSRQRTRASS